MTDLGPYSLDTIVVGDCLDVMRQMPDGCVDLVVTSPPYNNHANKRTAGGKKPAWRPSLRSIEYGQYADDMPEGRYQDWQKAVVTEMLRVTKPAGTVAYNHKNRIVDWRVVTPWQWLLDCAPVRQVVVWDRGSSPQVSPVRFMPSTERVYLLGYGRPYFNAAHLSDKEVWYISPCRHEGIPAFPEELAERLVSALTGPGAVVADFYSGSGTTAVAAKKLGRHYFGCDISEEYVKLARERVAKIDGVQMPLSYTEMED